MNGEQSLSLPDKYYQGTNYVVRTPEEDAKIRGLMADIPLMGEYNPPMCVKPGEGLHASTNDLLDNPVSMPLAPTEQESQRTEMPMQPRRNAVRAIIDFFRSN